MEFYKHHLNCEMKVGIITMYYNSINYGGNLQAYALAKYLCKHNLQAEQISYQRKITYKFDRLQQLKEKGVFFYAKKLLSKILNLPKELLIRAKKKSIYDEYLRIQEERKTAFEPFNKEVIPHSVKVYDEKNVESCVEEYDIFVTGSDQVWNVNWYDNTYFLDFVSGSKKKISYAASFAMSSLAHSQRAIVKNSLKDYAAISVREQKGLDLLDGLTNVKPEIVVDPTLLLDVNDWNEVCAERVINEKYVFAYYLGENVNASKLAEKYAKEKGLPLVSIKYASGLFKLENSQYGDIQLIDIGPEQFLSLIKHSENVFTDSFHAVVFSFIFKKQFFVFNRDSKGSMNSRITSLLEMIDLQDRFCSSKEKESLVYIENLMLADYSKDFSKFETCRNESYNFIRKNILE